MPFFLKSKKNVRTVETQTESETWEWEQNEVENIGWPDSTSEEVIIYEEPLTYEDQSSELVVTVQEEENPFSLTQTTEYENRSENSQTLTEDNSSVNNILLNLFLFFFIIIIPYFFIRLFFFIIWFYNFQEIFIRLRLSKEDFLTEIDPFQINFTQASISRNFSGYNGYTVEDTIKELVSGKLKPKDLPIIRICIIDRKFYSADNRRLYCYQEAIKKGANFKTIPVKIIRETDERAGFKWKKEGSLIVIPKYNWKTTVLVNYAENGRAIDKFGNT